MRICLINPEGPMKGLSLSLAYLSTYISQDLSVEELKVIDLNNWKRDTDEALKDVKSFDVVGFPLQTATSIPAKKLIKKIRPYNKLIMVGGTHITIDGANYLKENPEIDFGFIGETDIIIKKFLNYLKGKEKLENIPGLIYRKNNQVIVNSGSEILANLDDLPLPNFDYFDSVDGKIDKYPILTSRGCPFSCTYCCINRMVGRKWRPRSPKKIIEELKYAKEKYKSRHFSVLDANFTLDIDRAKEFCRLLIKEKLNMGWECEGGIRCDRVDKELFDLMKKAGCYAITVGIESGSPRIFKTIKKGETLESIRKAVKLAKKAGIRISGFFIIGLPGATIEDEYESIKFAKETKLDRGLHGLLVPYPGTEVWDWATKNSLFVKDWRGKQFNVVDSVIETKDFSREERVKIFKIANIKGYDYSVLINEQDSLIKNAFIIVILILKYDPFNLHLHIIELLKAFPRIYRRAFGLVT